MVDSNDDVDVLGAFVRRRKRWTTPERDELRAAIERLAKRKKRDVVPRLIELLDVRDDEVPHWVANALLAMGDRGALENIASRLDGRHAMSAVQAVFVLGERRAFDRFAPVFDVVRANPKRANPVASIVLALLHDERAAVARRDRRWLDLCFELAHVSGNDLAFAPQRVLYVARDARLADAFVRALDAFPFAVVAPHVRLACDKRAARVFEAAARDPRRARHAAALRDLAKELAKKRPPKRRVIY